MTDKNFPLLIAASSNDFEQLKKSDEEWTNIRDKSLKRQYMRKSLVIARKRNHVSMFFELLQIAMSDDENYLKFAFAVAIEYRHFVLLEKLLIRYPKWNPNTITYFSIPRMLFCAPQSEKSAYNIARMLMIGDRCSDTMLGTVLCKIARRHQNDVRVFSFVLDRMAVRGLLRQKFYAVTPRGTRISYYSVVDLLHLVDFYMTPDEKKKFLPYALEMLSYIAEKYRLATKNVSDPNFIRKYRCFGGVGQTKKFRKTCGYAFMNVGKMYVVLMLNRIRDGATSETCDEIYENFFPS